MAYTRQANIDAPPTTSTIGLSPSTARHIVNLGLASNDPATIWRAAMVNFSFLLQFRSVKAEAVQLPDLFWTEKGLEFHLSRIKGVAASSKLHPLFSRSWTDLHSLLYLIRCCASPRWQLPLFFPNFIFNSVSHHCNGPLCQGGGSHSPTHMLIWFT